MKIDDTEKQINIDDTFFKMSEEQLKSRENYGENGAVAKIKLLQPSLLPIIAFILIIVIGTATAFLRARIINMNENLIYLNKIVSSIDTAGLQSGITAIEAKLEYVNKENDQLKSEVVHLKNEMEALKAKKEKADALTQKQPAARKKTVSKSPRTR
jgi:hypothetical protein